MALTRRDFLKVLGVQGAVLPLIRPAFGQSSEPHVYPLPVSILQGESFDGEARFNVMFQAPRAVEYRVRGVETVSGPQRSHRRILRQEQSMDFIAFSGLPVDVDLRLEIWEDGEQIDARVFRSLSRSRASLKVGVLSCMKDHMHDPAMWDALEAQRPDLLLFLGDTVYADNESLQGLRKVDPDHMVLRYIQHRSVLKVYGWRRLVPIHAVWDDHDFGGNNSGREYPHLREATENFETFFARDPLAKNSRRGPGVSEAFECGGVLFALLDDRSFRAPKRSTERYAHWGRAQEDWLFSLLEEHRGPALLCNGSQWFPVIRRDEGFQANHPTHFSALMRRLSKCPSKVFFASGDVHFSEIAAIESGILGYPSWEITSSCMHSSNTLFNPGYLANPRRIHSTWKRNFVMLDLRSDGVGALRARARCYTKGPELLFEHSFGWK